MNFFQAVESMKKGASVQSLASYTTYQASKEGLLAEGLLVPIDYLTIIEANGKWREVNVVERKEDYDKLTDREKETILDEAIKNFEFHEIHREEVTRVR